MSEWESILEKYGFLIEDQLLKFIQIEAEKSQSYHPFIGSIYSYLQDFFLRGGKRLASCSTLAIYKGYKNIIDEKILRVCGGIELYRHAILVHDDLIDNDELRRGASTLHRKFDQDFDSRFGGGVAVFAGNILYTLALKALYDSGFNYKKLSEIIRILNHAFKDVNESQIIDLLFEYKKPDIDEWYIMASKRAASLFKASFKIGAVLAGAPQTEIQLLERSAEHIGYSFDIQDDIIDTYASQEQYGRKPGGDLIKNKKPLHIIYTYKIAEQTDLTIINNIKHGIKINEINKIKKIISECGALNAAKKTSKKHASSAKSLISKTRMNQETKKFINYFINYVEKSLNWYK